MTTRMILMRHKWSRGRLWDLPLRLSSTKTTSRSIPNDGLTLQDFVLKQQQQQSTTNTRVLPLDKVDARPLLLFHLKTFGCQMNVNDSDIVRSLLLEHIDGIQETSDETQAHLLLTNTCAIRDGAEQKVWHRLRELRGRFRNNNNKQNQRRKIVVGVLGCMAERLKEELFRDGLADLVVGPDAYRDLPTLVQQLLDEEQPDVEQAVNVQLSLDETYADITPVRRNPDDVSAFVSIQRGCSNRCSFCIVPFTRGQERSRPLESIVQEIQQMHLEEGVKEVTLLGQNVNSYHDTSPSALDARPDTNYRLSNEGFQSRIRRGGAGFFFADLLEAVSDISPELRVRFTSPHPKDYPPELLYLMAERPNVCKHLHMPAQSGSSTVLKRMKRGYTREAYLQLLDDVHSAISNDDVAISSDFITGFCNETEDEHLDTISLMEQVRYDQAFMFAYSMRGKTHAQRTMQDNVPEEVKQRRLREIINVFQEKVHEKNKQNEVGRLRLVLAEGEAKRSKPDARTWSGRTDQNKRIIFPVDDNLSCWEGQDLEPIIQQQQSMQRQENSDGGRIIESFDAISACRPRVSALQAGDYAVVHVTEAKGPTLRGRLLWRSSISEFDRSGLSGNDSESLRRASRIQSLLTSAIDNNIEDSKEALA